MNFDPIYSHYEEIVLFWTIGFASIITIYFIYTQTKLRNQRSEFEKYFNELFDRGVQRERQIYNVIERNENLLRTIEESWVRNADDRQENFRTSSYYKSGVTEIYLFMGVLERKYSIYLTEDAKSMLSTPLIEYYSPVYGRRLDRATFDFRDNNLSEEWRKSVETIFQILKNDPADFDVLTYQVMGENSLRSSLSVIKAFHSKFCDIPPFCRPTRWINQYQK